VTPRSLILQMISLSTSLFSLILEYLGKLCIEKIGIAGFDK